MGKEYVSGWLLLASVVLQGVGQSALLVCLPLLVVATGFSYGMLTAAISCGMAMVFFSAPFWGARSDRIGRLTVIRLSLLAMLVSHALLAVLVMAISEDAVGDGAGIALLFVSRILYGLFAGGLYPSVQAQLLDSTPAEKRARALSRASAAINVGRLFGPLAGLIAVYLDVVVLFFGLAGISLLLLAVVYLGVREKSSGPVTSEQKAQEPEAGIWGQAWPVFAVAVAVTSVFGALQFAVGPMFQERLLLTPESTSELLSLVMPGLALVTLITHLVCGRTIGTKYLLFLRSGAAFLLLAALVLCASSRFPGIIVGLMLAAGSVAMMTPAYTTLASEQTACARGRLTGLLSMMHSGGYSLGGLVAGMIMTQGVETVMVVLLGLALIPLLLVVLVLDSTRKKTHQQYNNRSA